MCSCYTEFVNHLLRYSELFKRISTRATCFTTSWICTCGTSTIFSTYWIWGTSIIIIKFIINLNIKHELIIIMRIITMFIVITAVMITIMAVVVSLDVLRGTSTIFSTVWISTLGTCLMISWVSILATL